MNCHHAHVPGDQSQSGRFYAWLHEPESERHEEDQRLLELIKNSYTGNHGFYGARRVFGDLREVGETCGRHRVERPMRAHKIKAVRGYKAPRHIAGRASLNCTQPVRQRRLQALLQGAQFAAKPEPARQLMGQMRSRSRSSAA